MRRPQWEKLIVYIKDGRLNPDNNLAENTIRPFVVGERIGCFLVIQEE
ncbi:MAG: IS66 family transposase [Desulfobacterales bacterium]|nr:IS66 family transposase [Desulfobacterales bacterium]